MRSDGNVSLTLASANAGDSIDLTAGDHVNGTGATALEGTTGLLGIPRSVRFQEGAGDGGRLINRRAKTRPILLKLAIWGDLDRQRETLDRLRAILTADDCELQAVIDSTRWRLHVVYESGLEGELSMNVENRSFTLADVALTAPQPWWEGARHTQNLRIQDDPVAFLSDLATLPLSNSTGIKHYTMTSATQAGTPVSVSITGPATTASVRINRRGFSIAKALTASDVLTVTQPDGGMPQVTLNGSSSWASLANGPRFPDIQPGANQIQLDMTGGTKGTVQASGLVLATNLITDPALRGSASSVTVDDATAWKVTTATSHGTADCTTSATDSKHPRCAWWTVTRPADGWPGSLTASIGGVNKLADGTDTCSPSGGALIVEQRDGDGDLLMSGEIDQAGIRTSLKFQPLQAAETIRVGWYGTQPVGVGFAALLSITPKPEIADDVVEDEADPLGQDPGYFDGTTQYAEWTGSTNASASRLHGQQMVGGTVLSLSWRERREQVR